MPAPAIKSRASSMPRLEAPSISTTSMSSPRMMASPISVACVWPRAFNARAKIRAILVLPTPRVPQKRYACAVRPVAMAFCRVRPMVSCPTTSANVRERYRRAKTVYALVAWPSKPGMSSCIGLFADGADDADDADGAAAGRTSGINPGINDCPDASRVASVSFFFLVLLATVTSSCAGAQKRKSAAGRTTRRTGARPTPLMAAAVKP